MAVTAAVTILPLFAVAQLGPTRGPLAVGLHVLAAVALSMLIARTIAALWSRTELSSDLVFGDLLLWGWIRRALAERRLEAASRELIGPSPQPDAHGNLLRRLSALLEARDPYTHGHSRRVARHAERVASELGLPGEQVDKIRAAALVHDIGKINVPRPILNKPGALTGSEFALVKRHTTDGAAMVASLGDPEMTAIVRSHHERIDGTGYPDGLAGVDIPLGARIIAVADTFDAITSARAYRGSRTHRKALDILEQEAGAQLDAAAVAAFTTYYAARRSVGWASMLLAAPQRLLSGFGGLSAGLGASAAPIATTICGVGGAALVGACLGGSALPAGSVDGHAAEAKGRQAQAVVAAAVESPSTPKRGLSSNPRAKRGAHVTHGGSPSAPSQQVGGSPALRTPSRSSGGTGQSGGSGSSSGGTVGSTTDTVKDVTNSLPPVAAPNPGQAVQDVTNQLPNLQPQVQAPPVGLP